MAVLCELAFPALIEWIIEVTVASHDNGCT